MTRNFIALTLVFISLASGAPGCFAAAANEPPQSTVGVVQGVVTDLKAQQ